MSSRLGGRTPVETNEAGGGAEHTLEPLGPYSVARRRWFLRILGIVIFVLGASGGAAFAHWKVLGGGSASATSGSMAAVTVIAFIGGDQPATALLPGGTSDVVLRVS